ncbi:hypothetical protein FRB94_004291 [Tulasnella sp. JGI-2019a]|nr:hypothetical protein FRB93_000292 [Tulasnella sp. JGI-2019a]KAG9015172.1 hypothetical protein FRB94_004291 [Tulasnella sp. JGI-2019a]KAG9039241.1 hypothetical protein FRB95_011826 [Tulasnella sp. JGI-2019a]
MPVFKTVFARSSKVLLKQVQALTLPSSSSLLFAISTNTEPVVLSSLVSYLGQDKNCIGCLASSPAQTSYSCAVAAFPNSLAVPFRSTIPGASPISLGKLRRPVDPTAKGNQGGTQFDHLDDSSWKDLGTKGFPWGSVFDGPSTRHSLPEGLEHIPKGDIKNMIYFSDGAPEGLKASLDSYFPAAAKMGLVASSTPFVTGRPFTLLEGNKVWSDGAVGLALLNSVPKLSHSFYGYEAFSKPYTVSSAESNLIHSLDNRNPVKELLSASSSIQGGLPGGGINASKDIDVYLGTLVDGSDTYQRIYQVSSGGPTKGILALNSESGPSVGTKVQFLYRPQDTMYNDPHSTPNRPSLQFSSSSEDTSHASDDEQEYKVTDSFFASSENGLVLSSSLGSWVSSVPGAKSSFNW